ncbi:RES family NAD+ phosphorylase [Halanaerobium salsuginis]|uniref:RES domain-containing protein n=1 Tax=Halanaerobium salsuginis TaxID=29563 RepID=A0A1I4KCR6_9FIRM|nr:RES family NAD+ phosphorylase [Halanaerobium salsuginis]SFL76469.1 RES domain-containing protein [Halanaerobium salsuginis]
MGICCIECFDNKFIKEKIKEANLKGNCDYCGSNEINITKTSDLGPFIRESILKAYDHINDSEYAKYKDYIGQKDIDFKVPFDILSQEDAFSEKLKSKNKTENLCNDLITDGSPSKQEKNDNETNIFDGEQAKFILKGKLNGAKYNEFSYSWNTFKNQVKHFNRFFDIGLENRENLLNNIAKLMKDNTIKLEVGKEIWRVRVKGDGVISGEPKSYMKEMGPPPLNKASNNRMSPAGIPYMYVADNREVCISEIKPNVGDKIWLGKFILTQELKILDLTKIPSFKIKSLFDPDYTHDIRWGKDFLKGFIEEISKPLSPYDVMLEYVPTQLFSEYIRSLDYNGIKYYSSQSEEGSNYTLFCGPDSDAYQSKYISRDYFKNKLDSFKNIMYLEKFEVLQIESVKFTSSINSEESFEEIDFIDKELLTDPDATFVDLNI